MLQIDVTDIADEAMFCITRNDFERVFELADDASRQINRHASQFSEVAGFHRLMVYAWVTASIHRRCIIIRLMSQGYRSTPGTSPRPAPGLRKAVNDPHGIYRAWNLERRYMRLAGHTPGQSRTNAALLEAISIAEWYGRRPQPVTKVVKASAAKIGRTSWLRSLVDVLTRQHPSESVMYTIRAHTSINRQLAAITP